MILYVIFWVYWSQKKKSSFTTKWTTTLLNLIDFKYIFQSLHSFWHLKAVLGTLPLIWTLFEPYLWVDIFCKILNLIFMECYNLYLSKSIFRYHCNILLQTREYSVYFYWTICLHQNIIIINSVQQSTIICNFSENAPLKKEDKQYQNVICPLGHETAYRSSRPAKWQTEKIMWRESKN